MSKIDLEVEIRKKITLVLTYFQFTLERLLDINKTIFSFIRKVNLCVSTKNLELR